MWKKCKIFDVKINVSKNNYMYYYYYFDYFGGFSSFTFTIISTFIL